MKKPPPIFQDRLAAGTLIGGGKYRLVERLAAGGNGVVWLADHLALGQSVVAKFPICGKGNQRQQLETEMKLLAQFSNRHPNIVNILDVGFLQTKRILSSPVFKQRHAFRIPLWSYSQESAWLENVCTKMATGSWRSLEPLISYMPINYFI